MIRICEIKRALTAMQEVKEFDDNAFFDFTRDPRWVGEQNRQGIEVKFTQGDVRVTLEAPVTHEEGATE